MQHSKSDITKRILISAIKQMSEEQLSKFVTMSKVDLRKWYKVEINGEMVPWWACEYELDLLKQDYSNIKFTQIPLHESMLG